MTPNILIVHTDLILAARLKELILYFGEATVGFGTPLEDGMAALHELTYLDLCICDLTYPDGNGFVLIDAVRKKFPRTRIVIVTSCPPTAYSKIDQDISILHQPLDVAQFLAVCQKTFTSLRGCEISHFQLNARFRSDRLSDWYEAYDTVLKREVYVTVTHLETTPEDAERFQSTVTLMAQAHHEHVPSVYIGGEFKGRRFACHEKWSEPSLGELVSSGQKIDARIAARIMHVVTSVLAFWDSHQYPHPHIDQNRVFLSKDGVVKIQNCIDPALLYKPLEIADLTSVANAVHALLPTPEQVPRRLRHLLNRLRKNEQVIFETEAGEIVVELYRTAAPIAVCNFLNYVDQGLYNDTLFHHIISGFVIQGAALPKIWRRFPPIHPFPMNRQMDF